MQWLASNWIWIAAIAAIFAMYRFGHGGHRHGSGYGHGGHGHGSRRSQPVWAADAGASSDRRQAAQGAHAHDAVGETSSLPAPSATATHTDHDDRPASGGRHRHRHYC